VSGESGREHTISRSERILGEQTWSWAGKVINAQREGRSRGERERVERRERETREVK
jgi:hypothetical protein